MSFITAVVNVFLYPWSTRGEFGWGEWLTSEVPRRTEGARNQNLEIWEFEIFDVLFECVVVSPLNNEGNVVALGFVPLDLTYDHSKEIANDGSVPEGHPFDTWISYRFYEGANTDTLDVHLSSQIVRVSQTSLCANVGDSVIEIGIEPVKTDDSRKLKWDLSSSTVNKIFMTFAMYPVKKTGGHI
ncbi:hypothetical protein C8Q75DRAFT_737948 [Abortiporus biennis]|nr:hypothetical protein C8Q75DRAFT_737948 [Abortiporus biennis]